MKNTFILIPPSRILRRASLFFLLLLLPSCKDEPTIPQSETKLLLSVEDVSCTEAWLKLTSTNLQLPTSLDLLKDNNLIKTINLQTADTLLYIDSLLPNQTYNFQLTSIQNPVSSSELSVTTMDTTSHNFSFETFEFGGEAGSCELTDVVIIDENNIWAVGEIRIRDSSANESVVYNAAHWDGNEWELKRIFFPTVCGSTNFSSYPAKSIFVFDNGQIWISSSGDKIAIVQDGIQTSQYCLPSNVSMSINKMWGISASDIYVVGNNGNIAHYNGSQWSRIESGTVTNINDIWGVINPITQVQIIYCAVSFVFQAGDQKILTLKNNIVDSLSWNVGRRIHSVWSKTGQFVYTAGGGIYENKTGYWNEITQVPLYYSRNIRGTDYNNIFVCGDFGLFSHFNGVEWKTFDELAIQGVYLSVAAKNNIVVAVGFEGSKAIILKGIRN